VVNKNKAIFLDRDGVISKPIIIKRKTYAPRKFKEFKLYPFVRYYLSKLKKKNFFLIVVTNQPDINNQLVDIKEINKMHKKLLTTHIDDIFLCPHTKEEMCKCRKPKTGMIKEAIKKYKINPKKSFLIGDRLIDIQAGRKMNCMNIFIDRNYDEKKPEKVVPFVKSFRQAAKYILKNI
jgi:D-glycero-D-manno-heptose 1,7-bisphosphate phosphatase